MGQYIFTPSSDVLDKNSNDTYGNKLYFKSESKDYNYEPFDGTGFTITKVTSAIQEGDYVYALTRVGSESTNTDNFGERKYSLSDTDFVKVKSIKLIGAENETVEITLSAEIQAPIFGETGLHALFDYFLFDREYNAINKIKIGFDRKPAQLVNATVPLFDTDSSQELQDDAFNPLFTEEQTFFKEAQLSVNATSIVINNEQSVPVSEQFPATSAVSNSLLGIPRAEEQLSLFSDVSTLGLDENTWEFFEFQTQRVRYGEWEYRDSDEGSRYSSKLIENIPEQAIELSTNSVPYGYPYNESQSEFYKADQYFKYKNFIILGNLLYLYAEKYEPGTQSGYLNPTHVRWGVMGDVLLGGTEQYFQVHFFGKGVSEDSAFRYIDKWTETWMLIKRNEFLFSKSFIDQVILNGESEIHAEIKELLFDRYNTLNAEQLGESNSNKTQQMFSNIVNHFNSTGYVFDETETKGTQPGYKQGVIQQVVLQTKEVYRYQPGRISGFTFGTRVDIDPTTAANYAEWGCINESDEYVFQLAGKNINIVRRSTVPLTNQSLSLSGGFSETDTEFYNKIEGEKPLSGGDVRPTYYELKIPQNRWNGDPLNGNGRTGYDIDPENVTMWKIEFSWYGAIGVQFYAYVPVGNGEARWVKLHRIIIENSLTKANLQDPYFRMRYNLVVGDRTVTTNPQFVYKYGSSVYIDGGDMGTSTIKSFLSQQKTVPQDKDAPLGTNNDLTPDDDFQPMLGLKSKTFIANRDGKLRPSRIITIPTSLNVSADNLIEVDILEAEAGKGFGFTYDNGLRWNPNASPGINEHNLLLTAGDASNPVSFTNQGGSSLEPYAPKLIDFVFDTKDGQTGKAVTTLAIVKQNTITIDNTNRNAIGQGKVSQPANVVACPRVYEKITPGSDSPLMIDETYDDAKVDVGGLNNVYVDWEATLLDNDIVKVTSNITGKPMAARFRIKKIGSRNYDSSLNSDIALKESVTTAQPLFELSGSASYFKQSKSNVTYNWASTVSGKSLAYPRIPEYKYSQGDHNIGVGIKNFPEFSPSATEFGGGNGIAAEFVRNFGDGERYPNGGPFSSIEPKIADPASGFFPFRSFTNGLQTQYYVKREVFKEYVDGGYGGACIPYSYAFGMTKLQKWDNAICTSDIGVEGTEIEIRFLNPDAGGVALYDHPFLGSKTHRQKHPEFRIGFTNKVPAKVTMDGTDQEVNENEMWNGTFEGANDDGSVGFLQDKDYIFTDYRCNGTHYSTNTGEFAYGERNWDYAQALQDDYRVKGILNEGKLPALDYNIGGMPSYLKLKVAADFSVFTNLTFHDDFDSFIASYRPPSDPFGYSAASVIAGTSNPLIEFDGVSMEDIFYTSASDPIDTSADQYNYDDRGLEKFGLVVDPTSGQADNYIVIKDDDGSFDSAIRGGLSLKGGGVSIRHITASGESKDFITDLTYLTEPIKFTYYADSAGTIDEDAYTSTTNKRNAFLIQVSEKLVDITGGTSAPINNSNTGGAAALTTTSSLIFKIVRLQYPSQPNGTELREVQKVFGDSSTIFYPVIKLREDAQINNINIKITKPGQDPVVISPTWKLYGASQLIKPLVENSPGFAQLSNLDGDSAGVLSAINENFIERNRLDGIETDVRMNKRLRKSISNPTFKALGNDPLALRTLPGTTNNLYDIRNKIAERSKKITSYYFGQDQGEAIVNEEVSLKSTFGEDRNRILPDQLGTKAVFIRAQKVNLGEDNLTAKVQVGVNVSEL